MAQTTDNMNQTGKHVHVYKIVAMKQFDLDVMDDQAAKSIALEQAKIDPEGWIPSDCSLIALTFPGAHVHMEFDPTP